MFIAFTSSRPIATLAIFSLASTTLAQPTITSVGRLPGGSDAYPQAVSGNGTTVVGSSFTTTPRAFRWTTSGGAQDVGPSPSIVQSSAQRVNSDGSVIVGFYADSTQRAFRWTAATGAQDLGVLPGGSGFAGPDPRGVSADGSVVVGAVTDSANTFRSFRWTTATGMQALPLQSGFIEGLATGISADGSVIVGYSGASTFNGDRAYRYTSTGYQNLGVQSGFARSEASGVSGDGLSVIGFSQPASSNIRGAFRWTSGTGIVPLFFNDEDSSIPFGVSYNGSTIVGTSVFSGIPAAVMWTSQLGAVDLNAYLPTIGVNLIGWRLDNASGVSSDGTVIVGSGTFNGDQAGWVVNLVGASTPCYANCDNSTAAPILNANDFQCFLNKFAAADSAANCDNSTAPPTLNANDFQCFLNKFAAGCS